MNSIFYKSPVGTLFIRAEEGNIIEVLFARADLFSHENSNCEVVGKLVAELDLYFAGKLKKFSVPLKLNGTSFRKRCWDALQTIPYGETISYKQLAEKIGNPKACRAVGGANHHNPIAIVVPCHRVIGANGSLTGFGGGLDKKKFLLDHEKENICKIAL